VSAQTTPALSSKTEETLAPSLTPQAVLEAYRAEDYATALVIGKFVASDGDADTQTLMGYMLMHGQGGNIDMPQALIWYKKAAAQGQTDAMIALGEIALSGQAGLSRTSALSWFTKAAKLDRTDAMRALASLYAGGKGILPNSAEARAWRVKAVNLGDAQAARELGDDSFAKNSVEALTWYEKAAALGDIDSAYIAAIMYAENYEIKPDNRRMTDLLAQAANAGHPAAMADYGLLVYQGNGVDRSAKQAALWFEKSAEAGDLEGRFLYAYTLAKGDGTAQNFEEAYYWLLRADADALTSSASNSDYDKDRTELKRRLENNVSSEILTRARKRVASENLLLRKSKTGS
jgi:TPR repeat protein